MAACNARDLKMPREAAQLCPPHGPHLTPPQTHCQAAV